MKIQDFKDELRSQLQKICAENKWDYNNNKQRGMAFENWCFSLFQERYPAADAELEQSVIRGDDMEIDIWFESRETEEVYLIQAKNSKPVASDPIDEKEVKSFFDIYDLLKDQEYLTKRDSRNPKIKEIENEFSYWREKNFTVNLLFISTGETTEKINALVEYRNKAAGSENVKFAVWDISELRTQFAEIKSVEEEYPDGVKFVLPEDHFIELDEEPQNITFVVKGSVLQEIAKKYKDRLFNWNIRRFLGKKGDINSGITETLAKEPQHFFYFNNGISALCSSFELNRKTRELLVHKLQIVNGAQTIGALRYADTSNAARAQVLVKLTAIKHAARETGLAAAMIRTNNTQNALKVPDFRANDRIQLWLEKRFKELKPKGDLHQIVYGRKRPYPRNSANQTVLKLQDFGKIRYAWLHDPRIPIADPARLFQLKEDSGLYSDTFGNDGELPHVWTDDQFSEALLAIHSYYKIRVALEVMQKEKPDLKQITRLRYYGLKLFKMYMDKTLPTSGITREELLQFGERFNKYLASALTIIRATLKQAYEDILSREEGTAFSLPRDAKVWDLIRRRFEDNLALALELRT